MFNKTNLNFHWVVYPNLGIFIQNEDKKKFYLHPTLFGTRTQNMSHYKFNVVTYKFETVVSVTSYNLVRIPNNADLNTARYLCQKLLNNMHTTLSFKFKIFLNTLGRLIQSLNDDLHSFIPWSLL